MDNCYKDRGWMTLLTTLFKHLDNCLIYLMQNNHENHISKCTECHKFWHVLERPCDMKYCLLILHGKMFGSFRLKLVLLVTSFIHRILWLHQLPAQCSLVKAETPGFFFFPFTFSFHFPHKFGQCKGNLKERTAAKGETFDGTEFLWDEKLEF